MYICNWGCRNYSHYHCCACSLLFSKKKQLLKHLITCNPKPSEGQPHSQPAEGQPHSQPAESQPHSQPAEGPLHSFSPQHLDGPLKPVEATVEVQHPVEAGVELQPPKKAVGPRSRVRKVKCTKCKLVLNKRNLKQHMARRHSTVKDITANRHLSCQPIEIERGIFAVVKSFNSNSAPIHVQKRTSGANHQIRCELDACVRNTEVMHRSGLISFDCVHLQSLQYCPPPLSPLLELREDVLRDIVSSRWFSEERKRACLSKKQRQTLKGSPSVLRLMWEALPQEDRFPFMMQMCLTITSSAE